MSYNLGQLVKSKLIERGWSQAFLATRISKSRSYMTYVISGHNPTARSRKFVPDPDVIISIARELNIPVEEALQAAGLDASSAVDVVRKGPPDTGPILKPDEAANRDRSRFDIAYEAAVKALKDVSSSKAPVTIKIDLPGKRHLVLVNEGDELAAKDIDRLKAALLEAYRAFEMAEARTE